MVAALVVAGPVLVGVGYSVLGAAGLVGAGAGGGPTRAHVARVLGQGAVWEGLAWSVWVAAAATILAAVGSSTLAVLFRGGGRSHRWGRSLAVLPLPVPHVVAGVMGVLILSQSGLLARLGHSLGVIDAPADMPALVYDTAGVGLILTLAWKELPFLALIAFSVLAGRGESLEEAARSLGAGPAQVLLRVTLPVLWRGMLPATVAVFTFAAGSYEAAALLAPSDPLAFPLLVMERWQGASLERRADAFVLALLALGLSVVAVAAHEWVRWGWEELEG